MESKKGLGEGQRCGIAEISIRYRWGASLVTVLSQFRMLISSHVLSKIQWRFFLGHAFLGWKRRKAGGLRVVLVQVQPWEKWGEGVVTARGVF